MTETGTDYDEELNGITTAVAELMETFDISFVAAEEISDKVHAIGITMGQLADFYSVEHIRNTEQLRTEIDTYNQLDRLSKLLKAKPEVPVDIQVLWSAQHDIDELMDELKRILQIHQVEIELDRLITKCLEILHDNIGFDHPDGISTGRDLHDALRAYQHHADAMGLLRTITPKR